MNNNTILFLNHLIYDIYNVEDIESLKVHVLESLKSVIPFECGSISMADQSDSERMLGDYAVVPERYRAVEEKYRLIERHDISRWQMQTQQACIFRASDLLDDGRWTMDGPAECIALQPDFWYTVVNRQRLAVPRRRPGVTQKMVSGRLF